jgi:Mlc titration factor MtfA (ptsG expression regulator)
MSILQRCGIMSMKSHLIATYPFLHQGAQLLVVAQATILPQKKGWLPCYTCMLTSMGWTNILSKCLLYICVNQHAFSVFHKILIYFFVVHQVSQANLKT